MPSWMRVGLIVLAVMALTLGLAAAARTTWWKANQVRLKAMGARARQAGTTFGQKADAEACVTEALARLDARGGFISQIEQQVFLRACLTAASRPPRFCDGVPGEDELVRSAGPGGWPSARGAITRTTSPAAPWCASLQTVCSRDEK